MTSPETVLCIQDAVLYPFTRYNGAGIALTGPGVPCKVRWEQDEMTIEKPDEAPINQTFTVYVDRKMVEGSKLGLGTLAAPPSKTYTVKTYSEIPDIKVRKVQRTVTLI